MFKYVGWLVIMLITISGCSKNSSPTEPVNTKTQEWKEDLQFIATQMPIQHVNLFHSITKDEFTNEISLLDSKIADLSDNEIKVGFMKIVALISSNGRDGHTSIDPFQPAMGFRVFPLALFHFTDGIFIVDAKNIPNNHIGSKIVQIGQLPIDQLIDLLRAYIPKDNEYSFLNTVPVAIMIPEALQALGVIDDINTAEIVVESQSGGLSTLTVTAVNPEQYVSFFPDVQFTSLPQQSEPLYLSNLKDSFWKTYLQDSNTLYFKYTKILSVDNSGKTLTEFSNEIKDFIEMTDVKKLVIDVRLNEGGDNTTYAPLLEMLKNSRLNHRDSLFVIIGKGVFSAASNFTMAMENETNATFIGEPTGGSPNHYGDGLPMLLPNSKIVVNLSSRYNQDAASDGSRLFKAPDILVELESKDYFSGIDPVMDAILKQ